MQKTGEFTVTSAHINGVCFLIACQMRDHCLPRQLAVMVGKVAFAVGGMKVIGFQMVLVKKAGFKSGGPDRIFVVGFDLACFRLFPECASYDFCSSADRQHIQAKQENKQKA